MWIYIPTFVGNTYSEFSWLRTFLIFFDLTKIADTSCKTFLNKFPKLLIFNWKTKIIFCFGKIKNNLINMFYCFVFFVLRLVSGHNDSQWKIIIICILLFKTPKKNSFSKKHEHFHNFVEFFIFVKIRENARWNIANMTQMLKIFHYFDTFKYFQLFCENPPKI